MTSCDLPYNTVERSIPVVAGGPHRVRGVLVARLPGQAFVAVAVAPGLRVHRAEGAQDGRERGVSRTTEGQTGAERRRGASWQRVITAAPQSTPAITLKRTPMQMNSK